MRYVRGQRHTARRSRRVPRSRGAKSVKKWKAKVARVAKSVTLKNVETKRVHSLGGPFYSNQLDVTTPGVGYIENAMLSMLQGSTQNDFLGREIILKGMKKRFNFSNTLVDGPDNQAAVRISCFKVVPYETLSALTVSQLYISGAGCYNQPPLWIVRSHNEPNNIVRAVYYDKVHYIRPSYLAGQLHQTKVSINIDFHNMKFKFATDAAITGSEFDIIWVVTSYKPNNSVTQKNVQFYEQQDIYYKDA